MELDLTMEIKTPMKMWDGSYCGKLKNCIQIWGCKWNENHSYNGRSMKLAVHIIKIKHSNENYQCIWTFKYMCKSQWKLEMKASQWLEKWHDCFATENICILEYLCGWDHLYD